MACKNGGKCVLAAGNKNRPFCRCEDGFHGKYCEINACENYCENVSNQKYN